MSYQQGPMQPGGYYQPPPQSPPTNVLAIVALVCAFLFAPAGLICGVIARKQIKRTGESGDGLALAGIIISVVQIVIGIVTIVFFIVFFVLIADTISHLPSPSPFPSDFPSPFPTA